VLALKLRASERVLIRRNRRTEALIVLVETLIRRPTGRTTEDATDQRRRRHNGPEH
jgi:hypothetical protein